MQKGGFVFSIFAISLIFLSCFSPKEVGQSTLDNTSANIYFDKRSGFFYIDDERTLLLGAEEPTIWVAFEELRPYPEIVDEFIQMCHKASINLIVLYRHAPWETDFLERLADAKIWLGIQVADVKEPLFGFSHTGGAWGTLPSQEYIDEQIESIERIVSTYGHLPNIAFWWIGGEFVEPIFRKDGGERVREIVQMYVSKIRELDPQNRPITCSRHILEYWSKNPFGGVTPIDLSDITDFTWITIATHMHIGDFIANIPEDLRWFPILQAMEDKSTLKQILQTAWELNGKKPLYIGSWSTKAPPDGPCGWSSELTFEQWKAVSESVPFLGGAYWDFGSHLEDEIEPHALIYLGAYRKLQATDNMLGLAKGYSGSNF